jgi:hypothetical protein
MSDKDPKEKVLQTPTTTDASATPAEGATPEHKVYEPIDFYMKTRGEVGDLSAIDIPSHLKYPIVDNPYEAEVKNAGDLVARLSAKVESPEEMRARQRRDRRKKIAAATVDGLSALGNIVGTAFGAHSITPAKTFSAAEKEAQEERRKLREENLKKYQDQYNKYLEMVRHKTKFDSDQRQKAVDHNAKVIMDMTNLKRSEAEFFANMLHDQYMLEAENKNVLEQLGVRHGYNIKEIETKGVQDRKTRSVPSVTIHKGNGGASTTEGDKNRRALAKAKELGIDVSGYFIKDRRDNPTGKFDYAKLAYDHPELYK